MAQDDDFTLDDLDSLTFESADDSHTNLDEYGVWVKSGPEDLSEGESGDKDDEDFLNPDELAGLDADLDLGSAIDMDGEDVDDEAQGSLAAAPGSDPESVEEIELDEFVSFDDDESPDLDVDVPSSSLMTEDQSEDEFLDIDIEVEDSIADDDLEILEGSKVTSGSGGGLDGSEEVDLSAFDAGPTSDFSTDFDDVLSEEKEAGLDLDAAVVEPPMDELDTIEENLTSPLHQPKAEPLAEALLKKIESELSSIKTEISSLKNEIGRMKPGSGSGAEMSENEHAKGGFFSDDDDEVIALTGDELDSILSSADVMTEDEDTPAAQDSLSDDLVNLDTEGNIVEGEGNSDIDLLGGTSLEDVLDDESDIPNYPVDTPIPGGSPLDLGVPDTIHLEDEDTLGEDDTVNLLNEEIDTLEESGFGAINEEEIDLTSPSSLPESLQMVTEEAEDVSSDFFDANVNDGDEPGDALEIPFDDDLVLDSGLAETPATDTVSDFSPTLMEKDISAGFDESQVDSLPSSIPETAAAPQSGLTDSMRTEIKSVLAYMDKLLASLPDEKIQEFAESEHFEVYKKLFEELGLTE